MSSAVSEQALRTGAQGSTVPRTRLLTQAMVLLSLGHLTTDLFSSAVPTLQPLLVDKFTLSLLQAGLLSGVFMFASSVLQLPFGILSDRLQSRLFSVFGPLAAGVFLSTLGWAENYLVLLCFAFLGGMGVAAFHPQSTTEATRLSGERRGLGVAVFITAGTFGLACGPPYFAAIIDNFGFARLPLAMTVAVIVCGVLLWRLPAPPAHESPSRRIDWEAFGGQRKPLVLHYSLVFMRSCVQLGVGQFLTLYLTRERGYSLEAASLTLALFFLAASMGSFAGGSLADRVGGRRVIHLSTLAATPFFMGFLLTGGALSIACLFMGGLTLLLTIPVHVVMAQELVPSQRGIVTSLMMGFSWGLAGITFVPLVGWIADRTGLETVLWGIAMVPVAAFLTSLNLPKD